MLAVWLSRLAVAGDWLELVRERGAALEAEHWWSEAEREVPGRIDSFGHNRIAGGSVLAAIELGGGIVRAARLPKGAAIAG